MIFFAFLIFLFLRTIFWLLIYSLVGLIVATLFAVAFARDLVFAFRVRRRLEHVIERRKRSSQATWSDRR